jgi:hypothetical protein
MKKKVVKKQTKLDKNKELRTHIDKSCFFDKIQVDKLPLIFCKLFPTNDVQITIINCAIVLFVLLHIQLLGL